MNMCFLQVARLLHIAIIKLPMFTSHVAMCEIHGIYHPGIHNSYVTKQLLLGRAWATPHTGKSSKL